MSLESGDNWQGTLNFVDHMEGNGAAITWMSSLMPMPENATYMMVAMLQLAYDLQYNLTKKNV